MAKDHVDQILEQWAAVHPQLDCSAMGVVGRMARQQEVWRKQLDSEFKRHELSTVEFDILATMRRCDQPVTPTELYKTLMLSSGAMSTRLEKLVQRNLVERLASEQDRRSCQVVLTAEGEALVDQALQGHLQNMQQMLQPLTEKERQQMARLLRKLAMGD